MYLTPTQTIITILAIAIGTMITRFTPFILFPENKTLPPYIHYLGKVLPPAMVGLLVVYCLKNITLMNYPYGLPEAISIALLIAIHKYKHNVLLSIGISTVCYMFLVQVIFI